MRNMLVCSCFAGIARMCAVMRMHAGIRIVMHILMSSHDGFGMLAELALTRHAGHPDAGSHRMQR